MKKKVNLYNSIQIYETEKCEAIMVYGMQM